MDDLILIGSNSKEIELFVTMLSTHFSLKDLGKLHYFFGVEAIFNKDGLFLTQHKYTAKLLDRFKMLGAKATSTPMTTGANLKLKNDLDIEDEIKLRQAIDSLQYLSLTRPDIAFTVNKLAQFMHAPTSNHWIALKRLFRYLKGTLVHGLMLYRSSSLN